MAKYGDAYGNDYGTDVDSTLTATASVSTTTGGEFSGTGTYTAEATVTTTTSAEDGYGYTYGSGYGGGTQSFTGVGTFGATADVTTSANWLFPFRPEATATTSSEMELTGVDPEVDLGVFWRVLRNQQHEETSVFDVEVTDTANPFGSYAIAYIDDNEGEKFDQYPRGTRVDFAYSRNAGITYENRFNGFVVERRELEKQGADALEVECYSFDQFLRRGSVSSDLTGLSIQDALQTIIQQDTPVSWVAGNVDVGDEQTLTRSYRGEKVENVLLSLRSKSTGEDFGVNQDLEFYWEPSEGSSAPRGIDNSQWFNYDIPEIGKEAVNEVTVYFKDGDESVTVDDGGDKMGLQDKIGTPDPVGFSEEVKRPEITELGAARDVGEKILSGRSSTLTGEVTTYGLLGAEPGDVLPIEIIPRGIDGDYRIAELKYKWASDETELTIVEKKGDQDDLLVRLSDSVKRVEMEDVNRDGVNNTITSTNVRSLISVSGGVDGTGFDGWRYTNTGRDLLRDAWINDTTIDI